ncbi:MAG: hypothetical protein AAF576_04125, partial [Pseudomonadota bacterium]
MNGILTKYGCLLVFLLVAGKAPALNDLEMIFADCVGRYSAEVEHARILGRNDEDAVALYRDFDALLTATVTPERAREVYAHRVAAKMAQASLLTVATFSQDRP